MRRTGKATDPSGAERRRGEVAEILAAGVVRLRVRAALPGTNGGGGGREQTPEIGPNWLEVPTEVRLTVPPG